MTIVIRSWSPTRTTALLLRGRFYGIANTIHEVWTEVREPRVSGPVYISVESFTLSVGSFTGFYALIAFDSSLS